MACAPHEVLHFCPGPVRRRLGFSRTQRSLFISESSSCGKGLRLEPTHIATISPFFTHRFITMKLTALQIVGRTQQDTLLSFFGHFRAVVVAKRYHLSYGDSRIYHTHPHKRFRSHSCFMTEVLQGHGRLRCFQHAGCSRGSDNVPLYSDYLSGALNQLSECRSPSRPIQAHPVIIIYNII